MIYWGLLDGLNYGLAMKIGLKLNNGFEIGQLGIDSQILRATLIDNQEVKVCYWMFFLIKTWKSYHICMEIDSHANWQTNFEAGMIHEPYTRLLKI